MCKYENKTNKLAFDSQEGHTQIYKQIGEKDYE